MLFDFGKSRFPSSYQPNRFTEPRVTDFRFLLFIPLAKLLLLFSLETRNLSYSILKRNLDREKQLSQSRHLDARTGKSYKGVQKGWVDTRRMGETWVMQDVKVSWWEIDLDITWHGMGGETWEISFDSLSTSLRKRQMYIISDQGKESNKRDKMEKAAWWWSEDRQEDQNSYIQNRVFSFFGNKWLLQE